MRDSNTVSTHLGMACIAGAQDPEQLVRQIDAAKRDRQARIAEARAAHEYSELLDCTFTPAITRMRVPPSTAPVVVRGLERYMELQVCPCTVLCCAVLCCAVCHILWAVPQCVVLECAVTYHTIPYHTIPYHTIPYHTIPYHSIPYYTVPYRSIPYHTIPCLTLPYLTLPYLTLPYLTLLAIDYLQQF